MGGTVWASTGPFGAYWDTFFCRSLGTAMPVDCGWHVRRKHISTNRKAWLHIQGNM